MESKRFNSTALVEGTYEPATRMLRLWFTSEPHQGYDYPNVPLHLWQGLCSARSAGTYYNDHLREVYGDPRSGPRWPRR
ncbi:KTSC domain-containing protein [Variovorax sp. KBW07]|uniref:KTSC domain-containing protein n=1 Tax=Variovorax sp. KBW07 TaxID=2153358 RepID=UPI000F580E86|nr:KTSC domain-containing protein [Variovorax sp. KBW07]